MMAAQILVSRGRLLGNKYCSPLPRIVASTIGSTCRRLSTNPGLETNSEPRPPKRHPQSFVSDFELELGELETELPPGYHQDLDRRDRGPQKPRHANDGKDSYWRPPWKSPRAEIVSAQDYANRPRVTFSESFASMHDAMAVLSWMGQEDKDGIYKLYIDMMTSHAAAAGQKEKNPGKESWGTLSTNTSHEYVVRVIAQSYNITTSRAAGVIELQHNEEQLKKDPDFKVNHALQAHMDMKIREHISEVYKSYGEKDPLEFVEDPVASTGTTGREDYGSPDLVKTSELADVDALAKKTRMKELEDAKVRIRNHIYVEDVDERTRKVKFDEEVSRLLKMRKKMGGFYHDVGEENSVEVDGLEVKEDYDEMKMNIEASKDKGGANAFEAKMKATGSHPERWKGKRANSVFVHNLPYEVVSQELEDHMRTAGEIINAEVLTTPSGRSRGWGTVTFATPEAAKEAIEKLNDTDLMGRNIGVAEPKGFDDDFEEEEIPVAKAPRKTWAGKRENSVFVANLPLDIMSQDLEDHMCTVGDVVVSAEILTSKRGRALNSGYVEFATSKGAKEAIGKLNDTDFRGRKIRVREFKDKENRLKKSSSKNEAKVKESLPYRWAGKLENSIFVSNLTPDTVQQDLKDHMSTAGDVVNVHIVMSKRGRATGSGFVEFTTPEGAKKAIGELNDTSFNGRVIRVGEKRGETKTWGKALWEHKEKNLSAAPLKNAGKPKEVGRTKVPKNLKIPVSATPYPENNRGHKEDPETRRPRWKYTAQVVNTYMQENPAGSKRHGKKVASLAKMRRHGRVVDGNTIIEEGGELRVASVAELEKTSWKHVRNESEFVFRGAKEAWLKRQLEGEVGGWGIQEEVNRTEPVIEEGKTDGDAEGEGVEGEEEEESADEKE